MNADYTLRSYRDELVAAAGRWHSARRRRRRLVLLATAAVALLIGIGGTAVAATGWLVGSPAPPSVKSDIGSYSTQLGFDPEPGKAVLVASDGVYQLYATTNKQGTYCLLVSAPWKRPGANEGGDCVLPQTASELFWVGMGGIASKPDDHFALVVDGRTTDPNAATVRFATPDGQTVSVPIGSSGFFIAGADVHANPCEQWTPTFDLLDSSGNVIGQTSWGLFGRCFAPKKP